MSALPMKARVEVISLRMGLLRTERALRDPEMARKYASSVPHVESPHCCRTRRDWRALARSASTPSWAWRWMCPTSTDGSLPATAMHWARREPRRRAPD